MGICGVCKVISWDEEVLVIASLGFKMAWLGLFLLLGSNHINTPRGTNTPFPSQSRLLSWRFPAATGATERGEIKRVVTPGNKQNVQPLSVRTP